jgi:hypothetical protein
MSQGLNICQIKKDRTNIHKRSTKPAAAVQLASLKMQHTVVSVAVVPTTPTSFTEEFGLRAPASISLSLNAQFSLPPLTMESNEC